MFPTEAWPPVLSRFWLAVWVTCPALHAVSAAVDRSRTPMVAARSARFTAVDLQQNGPATGDRRRGVEASVSGLRWTPPGGKPEPRASPLRAVLVQVGGRPADEERRTGVQRRRGGTGCPQGFPSTTSS